MKANELFDLENQVLLGTYARPDFVVTSGRGAYVTDSDGKQYLDFVSGIAVNAFGHADEQSQKVLAEQASKLWHCSNLYHTEPQVELAKLLVDNTFADKVFFCNSGTEAIEAAIKFARKWGRANKGDEAIEIISMNKSFHGRTYGALSATGQAVLQNGFQPMVPGFFFADFNDLDSVKAAMSENVCAIIVEPVQGEGGIYPADEVFLVGLRQLCNEQNVLLILDEIQCGFGRTGKFCAHEHYNITPDIMTSAKPIAAGLPLGSVLMTDDVAKNIKPGDHGTTFGGGPIVSAVAKDVLGRILDPELLKNVNALGVYFREKLSELEEEMSQITDVRGKGLMLAISLSVDPKNVISACADEGLLICKTGGDAVRFLPPLNVTKEHINEAVQKLKTALLQIGE